MALNPTTSTNAAPPSPTSSAASALSTARTPVAAPGDGDDADDFATQLQRAATPSDDDAAAVPAGANRPQEATKGAAKDGATAPGDDVDTSDASAPDGKGAKAAKSTHAADTAPATPTVDANALQWIQQQMAAASGGAAAAALKPAASTAVSPDLVKGIEALRKGAAFAKEVPGAAAGATASAPAPARGVASKADGSSDARQAATDVLGQGLGAGNSATDTRDSLAASLPVTDASLAVQAGSIGASPGAPLDVGTQAAAAAPAQASLPLPLQSPAFAPALGQQIAVWIRDGIQHAEVQLTPQELGPIRVQIAVEGNATRVAFHADVAETRDALQQALPQLSEALGQAGLSLSGGGVSDQSTSQSPGQSAFGDDRAGRGGTSGRAGGPEDADSGLAALAGSARPPSTPRGLVDAYA